MPDNRDTPMGLIPYQMLDGSKIPTMRFKITTASANIFIGDVVKKLAAGGVTVATASDGILNVGVVEALQDSNGVNVGTHGSSIATKYIATNGSGYAVVALAMPEAVFRIQADGATVEADIWAHFDTLVTGGSTTTGRSQTELQTSSKDNAALKELMLIGKVDEPGNAWGTNVDCLVVFMESTWTGDNLNVGI